MRDDFNIEKIEPFKVGLTQAQVADLRLPPRLKAKAGSSRRDEFVSQHGEDVFELEAVRPEALQAILREAVLEVLDLDLFNAEIEREADEAAELEDVRVRVLRAVRDSGIDLEEA